MFKCLFFYLVFYFVHLYQINAVLASVRDFFLKNLKHFTGRVFFLKYNFDDTDCFKENNTSYLNKTNLFNAFVKALNVWKSAWSWNIKEIPRIPAVIWVCRKQKHIWTKQRPLTKVARAVMAFNCSSPFAFLLAKTFWICKGFLEKRVERLVLIMTNYSMYSTLKWCIKHSKSHTYLFLLNHFSYKIEAY